MAGAESLAELKHSARLDKIFPIWCLVGGRVRKAENKAKAQHSWGLGLAELGNSFLSRSSLCWQSEILAARHS